MHTILETLLANAVLAALLAAVVYGVTRVVRKPAVVHALWLLVLLKLVTPPIVSIPIPIASISPVAGTEASERADTPPELIAAGDEAAHTPVEGERTEHEWTIAEPLDEMEVHSLEVRSHNHTVVDVSPPPDLESEPAFEPTIATVATEPPAAEFAEHTPVIERPAAKRSLVAWMTPVILFAWAIGSISWAATCYLRIRRFRRWLLNADRAPSNILDETQRLADRLGLRRCPEVLVIAGRVPPMTFALRGRTVILLPQGLFADVTGEQLSTLLAHELSHLRRRDHWIRRLEMAATFVYWWHPALWLARREFHLAEESCCDAWVAWLFPERARDYGEALLATLEYLAEASRAMALAASGSADAGAIQRRFEMILRASPNRRMSWVARIAVLTLAALILPVTGAITAKESAPGRPTAESEAGEEDVDFRERATPRETTIDGLVINADKQPIADVRVVCSCRISGVDMFKPIHLRTDAKGRFRANVPRKYFSLQVHAPSTDYEAVDSFAVQDGRALHPRYYVEDRSSNGVAKPVITLLKSYDVRFDLVDEKTQRPVADAAILYKEDKRHYWGSDEDYKAFVRFVAYRMLKDGRPVFQKVRAKLDSAQILVLATGYEPARLKLDETLKRGKTMKRIAMKPLPPLELTIVAPDGKPAAGATFTTLDPKEFRNTFDYAGDKRPLLNIEKTSDEQGIVRIAYPAFGDWAAYRVMHSAGYADLRIKDLPAATDQDAPIPHRIELAPYATIRGKYLPEVSENGYLEICRLKPSRMHVDGPFVRVELDGQRRFQIAPLLAGWHSIRHIEPTGRGFSLLTSYGPLKIVVGQTVDLTLGDEGRPVIGRLVSSDGVDFKEQLFKLSVSSDGDFKYPRAPLYITDDNALEAWWDAFWKSDEGRKYREYRRRSRCSTVPDESGRFHFPMVLPGKYTLCLMLREQEGLRQWSLLNLEFEVPEGYSAEPLDLGDLTFSEDTDARGTKIERPVRGAEYLGPVAVVASSDGRRLFVANAGAKQISVVDANIGKVLRSIVMPAEPTGLVPSGDGATLYVTCAAGEGMVVVVDVKSGKLRGSIPAGHWPIGPAISPDGKTLYVCNRFDNNVAVVGLRTGKTTLVPTTREPYAAAVTPDGKSVFVINHLPNERADSYDVASVITVIDTAGNKTQTIRLPNGSTGMRGICVSPDGRHVYATHLLSRYMMPTTQLERGWMNTNALSIIDARRKKLINTVLLDDVDLGAANPWGVAVTADSKTICVTHAGTHESSIIDAEALLEKLAAMPEKKDPDNARSSATAADVPNDLGFLVGLQRRVPLGDGDPIVKGPRGLAVIGSKAFPAAYFSDTLSVVDLEPKAGKPEPVDLVSTIALGPVPKMGVERRGEMLFNDATICFQHWQSCASCHPDGRVDGLNWDLLNDGLGNPKNARSMVLAHRTPPSMSSGVLPGAKEAVRSCFKALLFEISTEDDTEAIYEYLMSLVPLPSPYLIDGELSPAARRGKKLFFDAKINCAKCHPAPLFTDMLMHDVGSKGQYDRRDTFDTPTLIECWRTAPYMHDGRYTTMEEVFTKGRHGNVTGLDEQQIHDLSQYVLSLGPAEAAQIPPNRRIELPPITESTGGARTPKSVEKDEPAVEASPPRAADLAAPVPITAGGKPIDVDGFAAPFVGDFDEDGIDDLLVGQVGFGRLRIYRNMGSNARPKFDGFEWFKAGGRIAAVPIGCQVGFTPHLADFDGDGRTDILTGSFYGGGLYVFRRNEDGTFAEGEVLENKHGEVLMGYSFSINRAVPYNTTVFLHDWDGDGDGDLLTGKSHYSVVPNEGTRRRPVFGDALPLLADGELIPRGIVPPCVADWDGDGRHDLLVGRGSDIVWYRNTGRDRRPVLQPARILVSRSGWAHEHQREFSVKSAARPQAICTADFNGDGRLDLLVGDCYYSERTLTEAQTAELAKVAKAGSEIRARCTDLIQEEPKNETRQQRIERFRKVLATWSELGDLPWAAGGQGAGFDKERHGRVWLFERVDRQFLGAAKPRSTLKRSNGSSRTTP